MRRQLISITLGVIIAILATADLAKADPQFCLYENPERPKENLRYRNDYRAKYSASAPGCYVVNKNMPQPGGTAIILWPDGVTTKITIKTRNPKKTATPSTGLATVDGELADWSVWEEYCFVIRSNQKKICY